MCTLKENFGLNNFTFFKFEHKHKIIPNHSISLKYTHLMLFIILQKYTQDCSVLLVACIKGCFIFSCEQNKLFVQTYASLGISTLMLDESVPEAVNMFTSMTPIINLNLTSLSALIIRVKLTIPFKLVYLLGILT